MLDALSWGKTVRIAPFTFEGDARIELIATNSRKTCDFDVTVIVSVIVKLQESSLFAMV